MAADLGIDSLITFDMDTSVFDNAAKYRRDNYQRIFVNRNVFLDKIQYIGFDMDYTLAEYISPTYEELIYEYAMKQLVENGYPEEICTYTYNPKFATRGLLYDKEYGNFLKVDPYGNILSAVHGFYLLEISKLHSMYKNRFVNMSDTLRFAIFNTLFEFPAMFMIAAIINHFEISAHWEQNINLTNLEKGSIKMSYETIYNDVNEVFSYVHQRRDMKQRVIDDFPSYIKNDGRTPLLLKRIRDSGRKTFLITNSNYWYTDKVMNYLIKDAKHHGVDYSENWRDYFDMIVVESKKPVFFAEGTSICQIDLNTEKKRIGVFTGPITPGSVFTGGNSQILCDILGANGKDILYVGDHIYGDILKSKKRQGWRTYLVIPELEYEIYMWITHKDHYSSINDYDAELSNLYKTMDSRISSRPKEADECIEKIRIAVRDIEKLYGQLGSLMRCGFRKTFFAGQLSRFADLYSYTYLNLLNYPFFYHFRAPVSLLPHESTVSLSNKSGSNYVYEDICDESNDDPSSFRQSKQRTICDNEIDCHHIV